MRYWKSVGMFLIVMFLSFSLVPVSLAADQVNINTADAKALAKLKRIGPATATKIVEYRKANGLFKNPADITKVKGIGQKTYELNLDMITVGEPKTKVKPSDKNKPKKK